MAITATAETNRLKNLDANVKAGRAELAQLNVEFKKGGLSGKELRAIAERIRVLEQTVRSDENDYYNLFGTSEAESNKKQFLESLDTDIISNPNFIYEYARKLKDARNLGLESQLQTAVNQAVQDAWTEAQSSDKRMGDVAASHDLLDDLRSAKIPAESWRSYEALYNKEQKELLNEAIKFVKLEAQKDPNQDWGSDIRDKVEENFGRLYMPDANDQLKREYDAIAKELSGALKVAEDTDKNVTAVMTSLRQNIEWNKDLNAILKLVPGVVKIFCESQLVGIEENKKTKLVNELTNLVNQRVKTEWDIDTRKIKLEGDQAKFNYDKWVGDWQKKFESIKNIGIYIKKHPRLTTALALASSVALFANPLITGPLLLATLFGGNKLNESIKDWKGENSAKHAQEREDQRQSIDFVTRGQELDQLAKGNLLNEQQKVGIMKMIILNRNPDIRNLNLKEFEKTYNEHKNDAKGLGRADYFTLPQVA